MINLPDTRSLSELRAFHEPFCVSAYAPLLDPSAAANPNRIELKKLLHEAETALASAGVERDDVTLTLQPARTLLHGQALWPHRSESLALFMHPHFFRAYHLPDHSTPYLLTVGTGFNIEPLLRAVKDNQRYYVLALSHHSVRLYEGDHYQLKAVTLKNFPADLRTTLHLDEYPQSRETHSIAPAGTKGAEAFHQQYNVAEVDKALLVQFFRYIDRYLHGFLIRHQRPLVLAGTKYLLPLYRRINTYPHLLPGGISGNQEHADLQAIREKAWGVVRGSLS